MTDTAYLSELDLQTLAEDKHYEKEVLESKPTTFFRPDDRTSLSFPTYLRVDPKGISYIGFIDSYGNHAEKTPPTFLPHRIPIRVVSRKAKKLSEITEAECSRAYKELPAKEAVLSWLQQKYPNKELTFDSVVTVYEIGYLTDTN